MAPEPKAADPLLSFLAGTAHAPPMPVPSHCNDKDKDNGGAAEMQQQDSDRGSLLDFGGHDILVGSQRSAASASASTAMQRMYRRASTAADGFGEERSSKGDVRPNTWAVAVAAPPSLNSEADINTASGEWGTWDLDQDRDPPPLPPSPPECVEFRGRCKFRLGDRGPCPLPLLMLTELWMQLQCLHAVTMARVFEGMR